MIAARIILGLYNALLAALCGPVLLKKAIKFGRRGHTHEWDAARWNAPKSWPKTQLRVVFVALSWGETGILSEISRRLEADFPSIEIVWSIRDRAAQKLAKQQFPTRKIVPMPFDFALPSQNWVQNVAPDVLVVVEKFWWPNLIFACKLRGAKIVLVNGRSRGREKARYGFLGGFQRWILGAFDLLLFESDSQIERVRAVLPRGAQVVATGNVKFAFSAFASPPDAEILRSWLDLRARNEAGPLPLLVAGSTSPLDEKWALDAFETVRRAVPCALLIAPRRPSRADEVAAQIGARGLTISRRTAPVVGAKILLLDTLGELSTAYGFGVASYVGGATEGRGHNIIEPLAHGIAVAYGPNRGDFEAVQRAAEASQVGFRLNNADELADFWRRALQDEAWREEISGRAGVLIAENSGALEQVVALLSREIEGVAGV